jgi:hypothetical protein
MSLGWARGRKWGGLGGENGVGSGEKMGWARGRKRGGLGGENKAWLGRGSWRARMERSRTATSSAATTASHPLSSRLPGSPHRSRADSTVSHVSTPLPTGVRVSSATRVRPAVTESQTYSKCGVPPRITAPRQATASWCRASSAATTGSSIAPGTRTTSGSGTPQATAAAVPRATRASVISWCQRVATMARLSPDASTASAPGLPVPLMLCLLLASGALLGVALLAWPPSAAGPCRLFLAPQSRQRRAPLARSC